MFRTFTDFFQSGEVQIWLQYFKACIIRDQEVRIKIENCNKKWFWKVNEKIMQECCTCNSNNNEINNYNSSNTTNNIKTVFIQMTQKEKLKHKKSSGIPGRKSKVRSDRKNWFITRVFLVKNVIQSNSALTSETFGWVECLLVALTRKKNSVVLGHFWNFTKFNFEKILQAKKFKISKTNYRVSISLVSFLFEKGHFWSKMKIFGLKSNVIWIWAMYVSGHIRLNLHFEPLFFSCQKI